MLRQLAMSRNHTTEIGGKKTDRGTQNFLKSSSIFFSRFFTKTKTKTRKKKQGGKKGKKNTRAGRNAFTKME